MNRRAYLSSLVVSMSSGCLGRPLAGTTDRKAPVANGDFRIVGIYADEAERTFFDYEYVEFENVGEEPLDVSGYVVDYGSDRTYTVEDLVLESGATLVVSSRSGEDTILERAPPIYHRFADFGSGVDTSVLSETGYIAVRDSGGSTVTRAEYGEFGCDGGTVTVSLGSGEPSC